MKTEIKIGDVLWSDLERASCLVIDVDKPWEEEIEYAVLYIEYGDGKYLSRDEFYHAIKWIPESILCSKHWRKVGYIDISILYEGKHD